MAIKKPEYLTDQTASTQDITKQAFSELKKKSTDLQDQFVFGSDTIKTMLPSQIPVGKTAVHKLTLTVHIINTPK